MEKYIEMMHEMTGRTNKQEVEEMLADIAYALDQSVIVAITDRTGKITYVNDLFVKTSQYSAEELIGRTHAVVNSGYHPKSFFKEMWAAIGKGEIWHGEIRNRAKDGSFYWVDTKIVPFMNELGIPNRYISLRYDITERKLMEQQIRKDAEVYQLITENAIDFISVIDTSGEFQYISPTYEQLRGCNDTCTTNNLFALIIEEDHEVVHNAIAMAGNTHESVTVEFRIIDQLKSIRTMEASLKRIRQTGEYLHNLVVSMHDITAQKESELRIQDLACYDQLTTLLNRHAFGQKLYTKLERESSSFGLVYMNIDRFRHINDSFGQETGDYVLSVVAERLKKALGREAMLGRISGDEFAFILPQAYDEKDAFLLTERIQNQLAQPILIGSDLYVVSTSCGIVMFPQHGRTPSDLLMKAEKALHVVKEHGGGSLMMYEPGTAQKTLERILLENELRKSVQKGHFTLEYQPKMNLELGELSGVEALVRWNHPDLGRIPPDTFIPLAEETKIIVPLGEWILRQACKQAWQWRKQGFKPFRIAVNMSTVQLEEPDIVSTIKRVLHEEDVTPEFIEIELTESSFADREEMRHTIQAIREIGITVAIDDFGTGYSTFSYIKELPADTLKIDMSFIQDIDVNEQSRAIVKAIVTLADTAGLRVIAEGIETEEQAKLLLTLGCKEGQGYFYSKPVPADECEYMIPKTVEYE
ncbi:EAL domain-containing protein [Sporosarcina sp. OR05]|uniref:sensor domain-containing protein n=1 Tax=Sporosarcina sp. OR05 TaxID=2969819 RepID=UPI00352B4C02